MEIDILSALLGKEPKNTLIFIALCMIVSFIIIAIDACITNPDNTSIIGIKRDDKKCVQRFKYFIATSMVGLIAFRLEILQPTFAGAIAAALSFSSISKMIGIKTNYAASEDEEDEETDTE